MNKALLTLAVRLTPQSRELPAHDDSERGDAVQTAILTVVGIAVATAAGAAITAYVQGQIGGI